jgi:hypothetical protein
VSDDAKPGDGELPTAIEAFLSRPDTWDDPPADLEAQVLRAIAAEAGTGDASDVPVAEPVELAARRRSPFVATPRWLSAAAVIAVVVAGAVLTIRAFGSDRPETDASVDAELDGTELAPTAHAFVNLESTPAGLKILLDAEGLPGAGPDQMYEAWVSDGSIGVSAGTFHLRGGDGPIELWAGVADPRFTILTVTVEPVDGVAESSGQVVLRGEFELEAP